MPASPCVAVVGGGIAGTFCALVLRNRGIQARIFDETAGLKYSRSGSVPFLRASDPGLEIVLETLEGEGLIAHWNGKFGMLGSRGGGFMKSEIVAATVQRNHHDEKPKTLVASRTADVDGDDFCGFVRTYDQYTPTYVGIPNNLQLLMNICGLTEIDMVQNTRVVAAEMVTDDDRYDCRDDGSWRIETEHYRFAAGDEVLYDALVIATPFNSPLAAETVRSIASQPIPVLAATDADGANSVSPAANNRIHDRLAKLVDVLQRVSARSNQLPVYEVSATYPRFQRPLPFDAVSVFGSNILQFICRDTSKPGFKKRDKDDDQVEEWTAISTSQFANRVKESSGAINNAHPAPADNMLEEELLRLFNIGRDALTDEIKCRPLHFSTRLWDAAFCKAGLNLKEDCITLAPWRLAIAGDYMNAKHANPFEAAAVSGLQAGERVANFLLPAAITDEEVSGDEDDNNNVQQ